MIPQVGGVPPQVGLPFAGSVQTSHEFPQEVTLVLLLATHVVPQRWNPVLQLGTHIPPALHRTEPFAGTGQGVQPFAEQPEAGLLFWTHVFVAVQRWYPALHTGRQTPAAVQLGVPLAGT